MAAQDLGKFFQTIDFEQNLPFIRGKLQGQQFEMGVLNDLEITKSKLLNLFLDPNITWNDLVQKIRDTDLSLVQASVDTAVKNLSRVRLWFTSVTGLSVEAIYPNLLGLIQGGGFLSCTRRHKSGDSLVAKIKEEREDKLYELKGENLEDLIRGAIFCRTDTADDKVQLVITKALEIHKLSLDIHQIHLRLEEKGHPLYQGVEIYIHPEDEKEQVTAEFLTNLCETLKTEEKKWDDLKYDCVRKCPRLLYLSDTQLLQFVGTLEKMTADPNDVTKITTFVSTCFPELYQEKQHDEVVLSPHVEKIVVNHLGKKGTDLLPTATNFVLDIQAALTATPLKFCVTGKKEILQNSVVKGYK
eukprot:TRINITY_DN14030_c0_g3_i1.p1 TRINITY_DN14030_c0_g3~~TRINITY_DN14030_c0_g3_i1.p1  ORF type:complete len:380 (+),score=99.15 TRINITY_DN14030_c0_g3_i1:70-1140(+)